jgi:lysophospholipase L1-like esterase
MKKTLAIACALLLMAGVEGRAQQTGAKEASKVMIPKSEKIQHSQWRGKRVAFLGDSMTDKGRANITCIYWQYLTELLRIEPMVYGISGNQWDGIYKQALKLHEEKENDVDAILIFAGTNDYNRSIPLGRFFSETQKQTNHNGTEVTRKYRTPIINDTTFCGRINKVMTYLKATYPQQQIIIMTPIHRGFARFNDKNVQPDENYSNGQGLYIDAYVDVLKQAASYWAVPLIDLYSTSGLYPLANAHLQYFQNAETDQLHPNTAGNYRLAKTIEYQLLAQPSTFVTK